MFRIAKRTARFSTTAKTPEIQHIVIKGAMKVNDRMYRVHTMVEKLKTASGMVNALWDFFFFFFSPEVCYVNTPFSVLTASGRLKFPKLYILHSGKHQLVLQHFASLICQ